MYSRPLDQSTCRELPCKARGSGQHEKKSLGLVVQPSGEQIYCRLALSMEE